MPMPEAAVNENGQMMTWQHKVRGARQILAVKPEPVSQSVKILAQGKLRLGVMTSYATHHA